MSITAAPDGHLVVKRWVSVGLLLVLGLMLVACGQPEKPVDLPPTAPDAPPELQLEPVAFSALEGWDQAQLEGSALAYSRSCAKWRSADGAVSMGRRDVYGTLGSWKNGCGPIEAALASGDSARLKKAWEESFTPHRVIASGDSQGLFTGYYEPLLFGSQQPSDTYAYPLRKRPDDLVEIDLGQFSAELEGKKIRGRVESRSFVPYPDRADIEQSVQEEDVLVWVNDPIAKFFLQIQGSGQVALPDGRRIRVGYADQNGRPYRAVGRDLIEWGELTRESVSLQSIRQWMLDHPDRVDELMNLNRSYIFFHELNKLDPNAGPLGSQNVQLTTGYSLAVDRKFIPLGAPVWLETTVPDPDGEKFVRRLMVAQDTGGAITGGVRGDVFWGSGDIAEYRAGHMKATGQYFVFLPKDLALSSRRQASATPPSGS